MNTILYSLKIVFTFVLKNVFVLCCCYIVDYDFFSKMNTNNTTYI